MAWQMYQREAGPSKQEASSPRTAPLPAPPKGLSDKGDPSPDAPASADEAHTVAG